MNIHWYRQFWFHFLGRSEHYSGYGSKKEAVIASWIYISGILGYNFVLLWNYVKYFLGFDIYRFLNATEKSSSLILTFAMMGIILITNYFFLFKEENYKSIIEEFSNTQNSGPLKGFKTIMKRMYMFFILVIITVLNLYFSHKVTNV